MRGSTNSCLVLSRNTNMLTRLEREENERIAERKRLDAARLKERLLAESRRREESAGVRFKGLSIYLES